MQGGLPQRPGRHTRGYADAIMTGASEGSVKRNKLAEARRRAFENEPGARASRSISRRENPSPKLSDRGRSRSNGCGNLVACALGGVPVTTVPADSDAARAPPGSGADARFSPLVVARSMVVIVRAHTRIRICAGAIPQDPRYPGLWAPAFTLNLNSLQ